MVAVENVVGLLFLLLGLIGATVALHKALLSATLGLGLEAVRIYRRASLRHPAIVAYRVVVNLLILAGG